MGLEEDFGLVLTDMKSCISIKSLSYLTSVLRQGSLEKMSSRRGSCQENILDGTGHSSNWSESSGNEGIGTLTEDFGPDVKSQNENGSGHKWEKLEEDVQKKGVEAPGTSGKHLVSVTLPFVAEETRSRPISRRGLHGGSVARERHTYQISSQMNHLGTNSVPRNNALCSHLYPICRKILARTPPLYPPKFGNELDMKSVSEEVEPGNILHSAVDRNSPYQKIIGKISESPVQRDFTKPRPPPSVELSPHQNHGMRRRNKPRTKGIVDFSKPITNPLYKVYNPKGYQKTDEELAGESISKIGREFNEWLLTLEGDLVQLDPQLLNKILRLEMQLPDP